MWPLDLYVVGVGLWSPIATAYGGALETYATFTSIERVVGQFVVAIALASVVVGMTPEYGTRAVAKTRRSPIISLCIGLPTALALTVLVSAGHFALGSSIGTFFGVLSIVLGLAALAVGTTVGIVAIGHTVASRLGRDGSSIGVVVGGSLLGLAGVTTLGTIALLVVGATIGTGAGVRVLFGAGSISSPDERTVPPANKI